MSFQFMPALLYPPYNILPYAAYLSTGLLAPSLPFYPPYTSKPDTSSTSGTSTKPTKMQVDLHEIAEEKDTKTAKLLN